MPIRFLLAELMESRKVSGYALAQRMGMTSSAIYKLQRQTHVQRLNGDTLALLCEALECEPGDLLKLEKKKRGK